MMDYTQLTAARNAFIGNPGLCSLFKFISTETWKRLEFAYLRKERAPFETTITQNLVFAIQAYTAQYPKLSIQIQEAKNEAANGNDLELLLRFNQENWEFYAPIQAKKIGRRENYITMDHGKQIEDLISYSESRNGLPLYLLYNCIEKPDSLPLRYQAEHYGCSLISARLLMQKFYNKREVTSKGERVKKWRIPYFRTLHDVYAVPWHLLVCGNDSIRDFSLSATYDLLSGWESDTKVPAGLIPLGSTSKFESKDDAKFPVVDQDPNEANDEPPAHFQRFRRKEERGEFTSEGFHPSYRITININ